MLEKAQSSGVRQSKIIKGPVLAGLGGKGFRKRDRQILRPVNPFLPRGSPLTNKGFGRSRRDRVNFICSVCTVGGKYFVRLLCIDFTNLSLNLYKTQGN